MSSFADTRTPFNNPIDTLAIYLSDKVRGDTKLHEGDVTWEDFSQFCQSGQSKDEICKARKILDDSALLSPEQDRIGRMLLRNAGFSDSHISNVRY